MRIGITRSHGEGLTRFRFSARRGLSTVVTAALMLTAVAVLGSAMVTWSNSNLKSYETGLTTTAANNTNKISETVSIENIAFCSGCGHSNQVVNVTLTNLGTVGVKISQLQVNSTTVSSFLAGTSLPVNMLPQASYTFPAILSNQWHSKSTDIFTITTSRGSIFTTQAAAP